RDRNVTGVQTCALPIFLNRARYKELEEIITNEFISKVAPEQDSICAYIDLEKGWLVVDAASEKKASLVTAVLRKSLGSLPVVGRSEERRVGIEGGSRWW